MAGPAGRGEGDLAIHAAGHWQDILRPLLRPVRRQRREEKREAHGGAEDGCGFHGRWVAVS